MGSHENTIDRHGLLAHHRHSIYRHAGKPPKRMELHSKSAQKKGISRSSARPSTSRLRQKAYADALDRQVQLKHKHRAAEARRLRIQDERAEREAREYNPWGRAGSGAPLVDDGGHVRASLNELRGIWQER
eukprot:20479_1